MRFAPARHDAARNASAWEGSATRSRAVVGVSIIVVAVAALTALIVTGGIYSVAGMVAVGGVLAGASITGGAVDERRNAAIVGDAARSALLADDPTARLTDQVLRSLDGIEHRSIELGAPWPQLCVGPTGVSVIEVCDLDRPIALGAAGIVRGAQSCARCSNALEARAAATAALAQTDLDVPLRTIAVVAAGTPVRTGADASEGVWFVAVDELADFLARGPVLPMPIVDAAFLALSRIPAIERSA